MMAVWHSEAFPAVEELHCKDARVRTILSVLDSHARSLDCIPLEVHEALGKRGESDQVL